jgi:DNA-binding NarL/FixJ family response regulator
MRHQTKLISIDRTSAFRLDPTLTSQEAIVLRALAAGQTDRQVCKDLRMDPTTFLRIMFGMREKIGTTDNVTLIEWAKSRIKGVDQRIVDRSEGYARPR